MMKRNFIAIVITSILFGCASKELSEEEKQKISKEFRLYSENILKPAVFTALASCAYKLELGDWPKRENRVEESKLLSNYKVLEENPFSVQFQVKPSIVFWEIKYEQIENSCYYTLSVKAEKIESLGKIQGKLNKDEIKNINKENIGKYLNVASIPFNYMVFKMAESKKDVKIPERNQAFDDVLEIFFRATVEITICVLLGGVGGKC